MGMQDAGLVPRSLLVCDLRSCVEEVQHREEHEEHGDADGRIEKEFLSAAALIEGRREIIAPEGSAEGGAALLEHDPYDEEEGEDDFRVREKRYERRHL